MRRKTRKWEESGEDDPAAGLLNLFDVWIAFAVALLLAMASYLNLSAPPPGQTGENTPSLDAIEQARTRIDHFRESRQSAGGEGKRLGTAYRLKSGEVIYVPDHATEAETIPSVAP